MMKLDRKQGTLTTESGADNLHSREHRNLQASTLPPRPDRNMSRQVELQLALGEPCCSRTQDQQRRLYRSAMLYLCDGPTFAPPLEQETSAQQAQAKRRRPRAGHPRHNPLSPTLKTCATTSRAPRRQAPAPKRPKLQTTTSDTPGDRSNDCGATPSSPSCLWQASGQTQHLRTTGRALPNAIGMAPQR